MREEFEELPEIEDRLRYGDVYWNNETNSYKFTGGTYRRATFINGAYYAFQEQQKKLDAVKSKLSNIYDDCDNNTTVALLLDEIQELLK